MSDNNPTLTDDQLDAFWAEWISTGELPQGVTQAFADRDWTMHVRVEARTTWTHEWVEKIKEPEVDGRRWRLID